MLYQSRNYYIRSDATLYFENINNSNMIKKFNVYGKNLNFQQQLEIILGPKNKTSELHRFHKHLLQNNSQYQTIPIYRDLRNAFDTMFTSTKKRDSYARKVYRHMTLLKNNIYIYPKIELNVICIKDSNFKDNESPDKYRVYNKSPNKYKVICHQFYIEFIKIKSILDDVVQKSDMHDIKLDRAEINFLKSRWCC